MIRPSHASVPLAGLLTIGLVLVQGCATRTGGRPSVPAPASDLEVVSMLLRHSDVAVRILSTCAERAMRPELKEYCRAGATRLESQRQKLLEWQRAWATPGVRVPRHDDQYDSFLQKMTAARATEFDEAATRAVRVHAREGLTETTACEETALNAELKQFCREMKAGQQRALEHARNWICDWFKDCAERVR